MQVKYNQKALLHIAATIDYFLGHAYESSQIEEKNLVIQPEKFRIRLRFHVTSMLGQENRPNIA